jgi:methyltransferase (TIGR00027 family)
MHASRPSDTATYVAMGRALAHARRPLRDFSDPFALQLLPPDCAATVERILRGALPRGPRDLRLGLIAEAMVKLMASRTVEIDDGLRAMPPGSQVVIVGAGLDSRAYRLRELSGSVLFEVDHPATQAFKRERAAGLNACVRELRQVAVDLSCEPLAPTLARAGHSTDVPTAWVFEGVISYLTRAEVESSIEAMASRSAVGSRLLATYNEPRRSRKLLTAAFIARTGEPHRAWFMPPEMKQLLEERGFAVLSDRDGVERSVRAGGQPSPIERFIARPHHVVIAELTEVNSPRRGPR